MVHSLPIGKESHPLPGYRDFVLFADPNSQDFTDQAQGYIDGNFKTIHFYKEDVLAHKVKSYNPGLER